MMPSFKSRLLPILLLSLMPLAYCQAQTAKIDEEKSLDDVFEIIDNCFHWVGESGEGDAERSHQIARETRRFCSIAQQQAREAYKKYPNEATLAADIVSLLDIHYFQASAAEKNRLCVTASSYFKTALTDFGTEDYAFRTVCPDQAKSLYGK